MIPTANRRRADRLTRLLRLVSENGTVGLGDAARSLGVSSMTLRRDVLDPGCGLELRDGVLIARDIDWSNDREDRTPAYSLERQQSVHFVAKMAAGRNAARLVAAGDTIFVDSGTTTPHLIAALSTSMPLTIVCNALNIATAASALPRAKVYLLGGALDMGAQAFFSEEALLGLSRLSIDKAFIAAGGISETDGASCSLFALVPGKRAAIAHARQTFAVVDSSKVGVTQPARFAPLHLFEQIVTDKSGPLDGSRRAVQRD